jgi:hypothetical protein
MASKETAEDLWIDGPQTSRAFADIAAQIVQQAEKRAVFRYPEGVLSYQFRILKDPLVDTLARGEKLETPEDAALAVSFEIVAATDSARGILRERGMARSQEMGQAVVLAIRSQRMKFLERALINSKQN